MLDVARAFLLGVVSASSLALGAATARFWKPTNFVLGLLTAFGAGALLSAVTIDIVAPFVESGDLAWLVVGASIGGLGFEGLNRLINSRGGFLRKTSTTLTFVRDREQRRIRSVLADLERIDILDGLPDRELDVIARAFRSERVDAGEHLYRYGEPCDHLNVLASGQLRLATPAGDEQLRPHQAFGHLAFVSGTRHRSTATAVTDATVLRLSRSRLRSILSSCPEFAGRLRLRVRSEDLIAYIRAFHPEIGEEALAAWMTTVDVEGIERLPVLEELAAEPEAAVAAAEALAEAEPFADLPGDLRDLLARSMFAEDHDSGFVFFRPNEPADRLYVLADGEVAVVDASGVSAASVLLHSGDELDTRPFLTGMPHTATAIAQTPTTVWVLRRSDLERLMQEHPRLCDAIAASLDEADLARYLEAQHGLERAEAAGTRRKLIATIQRGSLPPRVAAQAARGAPLAIWLGLMLDGIPESLVIGAGAGAIHVSFIVGIFLSNYPEALASSVGMREQGFAWRRISVLWASVILVTGTGAAVGSVVFQSVPEEAFAVVAGMASGAMLTVITETMMPEALHRSGGFVGLAALGGFLLTTVVGAAG